MTKMHYPDRRMSVLCVAGKRRPQFLLEETPSVLPSPDCQSVQLPPSGRTCGNNHLSKRQAYRECFIPYGLLLYPTPDLSKVCSHSAFSHTDGGPLRQNPRERSHIVLQEEHGWVESFYWPIKPVVRYGVGQHFLSPSKGTTVHVHCYWFLVRIWPS